MMFIEHNSLLVSSFQLMKQLADNILAEFSAIHFKVFYF